MWNAWREANASIQHPDLTEIDLRDINLYGANFQGADLGGAIFRGVDLREADFNDATLCKADLRWARLYHAQMNRANLAEALLRGADLRRATLCDAIVRQADLRDVNLRAADLYQADLRGAMLSSAVLVETNFTKADLTNCSVYGISAWEINLTEAKQTGLVISHPDQPVITVDNLEVAQFIYLLLNNEKIRDVINTINTKAILILGRFTSERKAVLDALRDELRTHDLVPIIFDFDKPERRNLTETVSLLAHMSRFVIADITDAKSIPQELQRIVPDLPSLPIQPLILEAQYEYAMFKDFLDYQWVLLPYRYRNVEELLASLTEKVIAPVLAKAKEIEERRKAIRKELG